MTDLADRVEEALVTAADGVVVDVERMWADLERRTAQAPRGRRWHRLAPLWAAVAVLVAIVPVAVALHHDSTPRPRAVAGQLPDLPPWPDGSTVPPGVLPAPASPVLKFQTAIDLGPQHAVTTYYLYYANAPDRLCDIETTDMRGTDRLLSIECHLAASYAAHGLVLNDGGAMLGAAPRGAHVIKVRTAAGVTTTKVTDEDGLPQPLFFVHLTGVVRGGVTWSFVSKSGRVLGTGPEAPQDQRAPSPGSSGGFRRPATSGIAQFVLPVFPFEEAKSRLLQVYYSAPTNAYCSTEYRVLADGKRTRFSEDCGDAAGAGSPAGAFVPWSTDGRLQQIEFWGVMPAAATRAETTVDRRLVPLQVAHPEGMPDGVYAGSFTLSKPPAAPSPGGPFGYGPSRLPSTLYCLDAQGQIVVATSWNLR